MASPTYTLKCKRVGVLPTQKAKCTVSSVGPSSVRLQTNSLSISAVHQLFNILSICISILPTQQTTFISYILCFCPSQEMHSKDPLQAFILYSLGISCVLVYVPGICTLRFFTIVILTDEIQQRECYECFQFISYFISYFLLPC